MAPTLPAYTIKVSNRARQVSLRVTRETGLVVTVPAGYDIRRLPAILSQKVDWIQDALEKVSKLPLPIKKDLPEKLHMPAFGQSWRIVLVPVAINRTSIKEGSAVLEIRGRVEDHQAVIRVLKTWLKKKAQAYLPAWLDRVSRQTGLSYQGLAIRDQRTRWGSCTAAGNINLNMKLLLLPPDLVEYVIIHELCHTRIMSHSLKFWQLVGSYYPEWRSARKKLRDISRQLPI